MKRKFLSTIICVFLASCTQTSQATTMPVMPTTTPDNPAASASPQATSTTHPTEAIPIATPEPFEPKYTFELVNEIGRGIIKNMAVSPDGKVLVVASTTGVWMYRMSDGKLLESQAGDPTISIPHSEVADIFWSPDGKYLAVTQDRNGIWIWDAVTWELMTESSPIDTTKRIHDTPGFAWSPDSSQLALGKGEGEIQIWTVQNNQWEILENKLPEINNQLGILWTSEDQLQVVIGMDLYDIRTGELIGPYPNWIDGIGRLVWSPNQNFVYVLFDLGGGVIDTETGESIIGCCNIFAWSHDSDHIALYPGYESIIYTENVRNRSKPEQYPQTDEVFALAWSPSGDLLAAIHENGTTILKNLTTNQKELDLSQHDFFYMNDCYDHVVIYTDYQRRTTWDENSHSIENFYEYWRNGYGTNPQQRFEQEVIDNKIKISVPGRIPNDYYFELNQPMVSDGSNTNYDYYAKMITDVVVPFKENEVFAGNQNGDIVIWEKNTGDLIGYVDAFHANVLNLLLHDNILYSNSRAGTVKVWEIVPIEN